MLKLVAVADVLLCCAPLVSGPVRADCSAGMNRRSLCEWNKFTPCIRAHGARFRRQSFARSYGTSEIIATIRIFLSCVVCKGVQRHITSSNRTGDTFTAAIEATWSSTSLNRGTLQEVLHRGWMLQQMSLLSTTQNCLLRAHLPKIRATDKKVPALWLHTVLLALFTTSH